MFKLAVFGRASMLLLSLLFSHSLLAQTKISGKVVDKKGNPVEFANVIIKGTYDGTATDLNGKFEFSSSETGTQTLMVSFVGFVTYEEQLELNGTPVELEVELKPDMKSLDPIVVGAGAFEASDEKKGVVLSPMDIVTTAGSNGDLMAVMQTLPGTTTVGDQEGIFVRGGSAAETKTIIDEMVVRNPFFSSVPDVPQRGRFSPFQFKGTIFSTGGYSAQYGQALSSALILKSQDMSRMKMTGLGILPIGGFLSHSDYWKTGSISVEGGYNNMHLFFLMNKQLRDWEKVPQGANGAINFRQKTGKNGLFKFYGSYSFNTLSVNYPDIEDSARVNNFSLTNHNIYINSSWKSFFAEDKWSIFLGSSYSYNRDSIQGDFGFGSVNHMGQFKAQAARKFGKTSRLLFGAEQHHQNTQSIFNGFGSELIDNYSAAYAEGEIQLTPWMAGRVGVRGEYSSIIDSFNIAPRASLALRMNESMQFNLAYGMFHQTPDNIYLSMGQPLEFETADHYIANFQWMQRIVKKNKKEENIQYDYTFRVEGYYKKYRNMVSYVVDSLGFFNMMSNSGDGYAQGIDGFWRQKITFPNTYYIDYWVSYSYLDTKRKYLDFPTYASPNFTNEHNASVVTKFWIPNLRFGEKKVRTNLNINVTYSYASGRPYFNPNRDASEYLTDLTPEYHMLSTSLSWLPFQFGSRKTFMVVFASVNNVLGRENVFGYTYSSDGSQRVATGPPSLRTFMVGVFLSWNHDFKELPEAPTVE